MSTSTNAILFYGYCFDEGNLPPGVNQGDDDGSDWEEIFAQKLGIEHPTESYPHRPSTKENNWGNNITDWTPEEQAIRDKYSAFWKKQRDAVAEHKVTVGYHCSCDYLMTYVAIKESETIARRGCPEEISSTTVKKAWAKQLAEFVELMGVDVGDQKPKWWLVSHWC